MTQSIVEQIAARLEAAHYARQPKPVKKLGRTGPVLFLVNSDPYGWEWYIEQQNGVIVAQSALSYRSRWDAKRSALRLMPYLTDIRTAA